jgi:hypothetical protein
MSSSVIASFYPGRYGLGWFDMPRAALELHDHADRHPIMLSVTIRQDRQGTMAAWIST